MQQISDRTYHYTGFWQCASVCRLRIYQQDGSSRTVVIATELIEENEGTSITNMAEHLATLVRRELGVPLDDFTWIEHYPPRLFDRRGRPELDEEFSRVRFSIEGGTYKHPRWQHLSRADVEQMIGQPL